MTDKAETILQELEAVVASVGALNNIRHELDRAYDVHAEDRQGIPSDFPLIVLRSGSEEVSPIGSPNPRVWDVRWVMRPSVEVYLKDKDTAALRTLQRKVWADFRTALKGSKILSLITERTLPEMRMDIEPSSVRPDISVMVIELGFTFDR